MARPRPVSPARARRAFTLVEMLVVLGLSGLVIAAGLGFFVQGLKIYHFDTAKLMVNRDIRAFTSEMTDNATYANYFKIYTTFAHRTTTEGSGSSAVTVDASVADGLSGDYLLLVFTDTDDPSKVNRLIGYYRDPDDPDDPASEGPVRKFDLTVSPSSNANLWEIMPATSTAGSHSEVIELSRGFADGKLFYNYHNRSVMVRGQIIHRGDAVGTVHERAANTYNFTVSPRG